MSMVNSLKEILQQKGANLAQVKKEFWARDIETAGWCFTATGSRFSIHDSPGAAVTPEDKIADAGVVHKLTGVTPEMAINTLVDLVQATPQQLQEYCEKSGVRVGSLCPNLARDSRFRFGTLTNNKESVRAAATQLVVDCLEHAELLNATALSIWLPDGLHYPGQDNILQRHIHLNEELKKISALVPKEMQFLLEYKNYEPAPYYTDIPDWGTALSLVENAGENCTVLVDFGHHAHGVNIPAILAILGAKNRLGALHLNDRMNADDDLTVGSINPYMMFLSMAEIAAMPNNKDVRFGFDQHHTTKSPLLATIQSVCRVQEYWLKALLIDQEKLRSYQLGGDTLGAEEVLQDAFTTDVRPLIELWREEKGLAPDPILELRNSGILSENENTRG